MKQYNCKNCGAVLYWNPTAGCLECEYCLKQYQIADFEEEEQKAEKKAIAQGEFIPKELEDENVQATDESDSGDLVIYKCSKCGAEVVTSRTTIATTCAFCGEAVSITNKIVDNFKPDCVIPFAITKEKAIELYREYTKKGVLTPKDFNQKNEVEKMKGIYAPFWLHSFTNYVDATVYCENSSSTRRGYDKVTTYKMYDVDVKAQGQFDNMPADALKNIDNKLMDEIEPFDYTHLEKFSPAYMAGYYAEEYGDDASATFERVEKRANETMRKQVLDSVTGYQTERISSYRNVCKNKSSKYTMLPVWLFHTKYDGKDYLYAVNGQTGRVAGNLPICTKSLIKYGALVFGGSQILAMILRVLMVFG